MITKKLVSFRFGAKTLDYLDYIMLLNKSIQSRTQAIEFAVKYYFTVLINDSNHEKNFNF